MGRLLVHVDCTALMRLTGATPTRVSRSYARKLLFINHLQTSRTIAFGQLHFASLASHGLRVGNLLTRVGGNNEYKRDTL